MKYKIIKKSFIKFYTEEFCCIYHLSNIDGINIDKDSIELIIKGYSYTLPIILSYEEANKLIKVWIKNK